MKQPREPRPDHLRRMVVILYFLLGIFGLLTIAASQYGGEAPFHLPLRQGLFLLLGTALLLGSAQIPFAWYQRNCGRFWLLSMGLLYLLPFFGVRLNGMRGWFRLGDFLLQPSELTKAFFLLTLVICRPRRNRRYMFPVMLLAGATWIFPILFQPDFGTAAIYLALFLSVLFLAGANWKQLAGLIGAGGAAALWFLIRYPYARERIMGLLQPDADPLGASWHIRQFVLTVARGGFWGNRIDGAIWSYAYLPLPYNDSAFATLAECLGFCGVILVLGLFALLVMSMLKLSLRAGVPETRRIFIQGAAVLVAVQSLVHISVNLALLPPTGLTLPLISYGGSSMLGCGLLLGMALSAAAAGNSRFPASAEPPPPDADGETRCVDDGQAARSQ